jgi:hypothetical protein
MIEPTPSTEDRQIIAELARIAPAVRSYMAHFEEARKQGIEHPARPDLELDTIIVDLLDITKRHPLFGKSSELWFGPQALSLFPGAHERTLAIVANERGPEDALKWFLKLYQTTRTTLRFIAEIHGLNFNASASFSNGVRIVQIHELPDTHRSRFLNNDYLFSASRSAARYRKKPVAAVYEMDSVGKPGPYTGPSFSPEIGETVHAFSLIHPAAPIVGLAWTEYCDSDLARSEHLTWRLPLFDGPSTFTNITSIYEDDLKKIEKILLLKPAVRKLIGLAAERLILARRRVSTGNRAIDIGVCLETIFCSSNERGEINYRLGLRAALYLETDMNRRNAIRNEVRDLYALRSKAAHGFQGEWTAQEAQIALRGLEIAANSLDRLLELGELPIWRDWENAGGRPNFGNAIS